jgi:hypothetical protein
MGRVHHSPGLQGGYSFSPGGGLALALGDRCHFQCAGGTSYFLGRVGSNAEFHVPEGVAYIYDWKVHLCGGDERLHLKGIAPLEYGIVRKLERRIWETSDKLIGTATQSHPGIPLAATANP